MNNFPIIATILSMVLGLSITRLLTGLVTLFRIRKTAPTDWVPIVWAAVLFSIQLEYWWAINQLPTLESSFSYLEFLFFVLLTLMLFVTASLLLPTRSEDEASGVRVYFEQDGRFALLSLSAFLTLGLVLNVFVMKVPLWSYWAILDIFMITLPIIGFLAKSRKIYAAITLVYLPLMALDIFVSLNE